MEIKNKYISRNFAIKKTFEAGLILTGPEVKSCKQKQVSFKGAYCGFGVGRRQSNQKRYDVQDGRYNINPAISERDFYLVNFYVSPYAPAKREQNNYDPHRARKLLLKAQELSYLRGKVKERGVVIVPIKMYTKNRLLKMEIAVAHGLKKYDKRAKIKQKEFKRRKLKLEA